MDCPKPGRVLILDRLLKSFLRRKKNKMKTMVIKGIQFSFCIKAAILFVYVLDIAKENKQYL